MDIASTHTRQMAGTPQSDTVCHRCYLRFIPRVSAAAAAAACWHPSLRPVCRLHGCTSVPLLSSAPTIESTTQQLQHGTRYSSQSSEAIVDSRLHPGIQSTMITLVCIVEKNLVGIDAMVSAVMLSSCRLGIHITTPM